MKLTLDTKTYCGIDYGHSRWSRHLGACEICKQKHAEKIQHLEDSWKYECECGCGMITNYGKKRILGHGATGAKRTDEQLLRYTESWTDDRRLRKSEFMKSNNPMFLEENKQKFRGDNNPSKRPEIRAKLKEFNVMKNPIHRASQVAGCNTKEEKLRRSELMKTNNPSYNKATVEKRIDTYTRRMARGDYQTRSCFKTGYYISRIAGKMWYDSSLELKRMKQLDNSNVEWTKKHKIRMPYVNANGLNTFYVPDFLISDNIIEETKGWIKGGDLLKAEIARDYCKKNGYMYRFLLGDELTEMKEYGYYGD